MSTLTGKTDYTKLSPSQENALIAELADYLEGEFSSDELQTAKARYVESTWPDKYVNSETRKRYKPHSEEERAVCFSDEPLNIACLGGEGCVAAETLISGVPIADISSRYSVQTMIGSFRAWKPWLKGHADLYKVTTVSGREVVVTSEHKFLGVCDWRKLQHLSTGEIIAAYEEDGNSVFWDEIQSISFVKHGDFYDLHVPIAHHYMANGLVHHNSGKTAMGVVKDLDRLRKGCSGILASPDFEHFRKSLWPEFRRWCPWDRVAERQQYLQELDRPPQKPFQLVFNNEVGTQSVLMCGGAYESEAAAWEGPNVNFAHLDEMRRHKTPALLKVVSGRVRIPGPNGETPQMWFTTTPRYHWLYDYFGPLLCRCAECDTEYEWDLKINTVPTCPECASCSYTTDDPLHAWKLQSSVLRLSTKDNEENLYKGFATQRALSLSAAEARVLLEAAWEDTDEDAQFLPSMELWNRLESTDIPPLSPTDPLILGADAAKGRFNSESDCFAIVGVTRHWLPALRRNHCVIRYVRIWTAAAGQSIDFKGTPKLPGPELEIRRLCDQYNVIQVAYDPFQLHDMMTRMQNEHIVWTEECGQGKERLQADSDLLQVIIDGRIVHSGEKVLREHLQNSDKKVDDAGSKTRIVKRYEKRKIDAAVALSMAVYRCLYLNIGHDKPRRSK